MAVVLLIDDDAFFRGVFCRMLAGGGHSVIEADGGVEGIEAYKQHRPDVVIVDIFMPDIEGGEVIQRLKQLDADARIIAISGQSVFHQSVDHIDRIKKVGARAILRKVDSREMIFAAIQEALRPADR